MELKIIKGSINLGVKVELDNDNEPIISDELKKRFDKGYDKEMHDFAKRHNIDFRTGVSVNKDVICEYEIVAENNALVNGLQAQFLKLLKREFKNAQISLSMLGVRV